MKRRISLTIAAMLLTVMSAAAQQTVTVDGVKDTYWRGMQTGEWFIGFADGNIIYDGKLWHASETKAKKDSYMFSIGRVGEKQHTVKVGRMKNGVRSISIDGNKAVECNVISESALGDYPLPDETSQWNKDDISRIDTAYIRGWLKNSDKKSRGRGEKLKACYDDIFTDDQVSLSVSLDSLGCFEIKIPMADATPILFSHRRFSGVMVFEPGKHYFVLSDMKTGQNLVMGDDARVQNEMLAQEEISGHVFQPYYIKARKNPEYTAEDYLDYILADYSKAKANLDKAIREHPTLSARFREYVSNDMRTNVGDCLSQANFRTNMMKSERFHQFIVDSCLTRLPRPYTLYPDMLSTASDYSYVVNRGQDATVSVYTVDGLRLLLREGKLTATKEELHALYHWNEALSKYMEEIKRTPEEKRDSVTKAFNDSPICRNFDSLKSKVDSATLADAEERGAIEDPIEILRSIPCEQALIDICASKLFLMRLSGMHEPLSAKLEEYARATIQNPMARERVMAENQKYIDLRNANYESIQKSLRTIDFGDNVNGGKEMLAEILRPLRGKMVLVDLWGTWCGPCCEALKHSQELYKALDAYDIAYVYLANRSSDEGWKNVIQQNNIVGENVHHYNLPRGQQSEIESALNVSSFPCYRLFDREGNLIDAEVDARDVTSLKALLDKLGARRSQ